LRKAKNLHSPAMRRSMPDNQHYREGALTPADRTAGFTSEPPRFPTPHQPPLRPPLAPPRHPTPLGHHPRHLHPLVPPHHPHLGRTPLRLRHRPRQRRPHRHHRPRHHLHQSQPPRSRQFHRVDSIEDAGLGLIRFADRDDLAICRPSTGTGTSRQRRCRSRTCQPPQPPSPCGRSRPHPVLGHTGSSPVGAHGFPQVETVLRPGQRHPPESSPEPPPEQFGYARSSRIPSPSLTRSDPSGGPKL
jgi:hypothetical protein